jgi:hypothetical protein
MDFPLRMDENAALMRCSCKSVKTAVETGFKFSPRGVLIGRRLFLSSWPNRYALLSPNLDWTVMTAEPRLSPAPFVMLATK